MKFVNSKKALTYYRKENAKASIEVGAKKFTSRQNAGDRLTYLVSPQKEIVKYWLLDNETFNKIKPICGRTLILGKHTNSRCCQPPGFGTSFKIGYCNFCIKRGEGAVVRHYVSEIISPDKFSPFVSMFQAQEDNYQGDRETLEADIGLLSSVQYTLIRSMLNMGIEPPGWSDELHKLLISLISEKKSLIKLKFAIEKIQMLTQEDVERWLLSVRSKLNRELGEKEGDKIFYIMSEASGVFDRSQFVGTELDPLKVDTEKEEKAVESYYRKIAKHAGPTGYGAVENVDFKDITNEKKNGKNGKKKK